MRGLIHVRVVTYGQEGRKEGRKYHRLELGNIRAGCYEMQIVRLRVLLSLESQYIY